MAAVILAAGMSRRMKNHPSKPKPGLPEAPPEAGPKQLLRLSGRPLLQHTLDSVRRSQVDEIVLVLGFAADSVMQQIAADGVRVIVNQEYEQGMGTSLRAGISALGPSANAAFAVLADQPFVRPETLNRMIAYHKESGAQITIPLYRGFRGNPVLLDRSVFPEVMGLSGDVGCRAIFGSHTQGIHKLDVDDPGTLLDIDSFEDFEKLTRPGWAGELGLPDLEVREGLAADWLPELVIVGRDAVARALSRLGQVLGFTTILVDPFLKLTDAPEAGGILHVMDFSRLGRKKERYVLVASRGQFDEEGVEQAVRSGASYVALLANRKRASEIFSSLQLKGLPEEKLAKVRAPAGLEIGAESPEEIALSILAEIVRQRRKG